MDDANLDSVLKDLQVFRVKQSDFKVERLIAEGGFGKVYLGIYIPTGCRCAVKKLNYEKLEGKDLMYFVREVQILSLCDNFFLLPFVGFTFEYPFTIVTEYIPNGSLFDALQNSEKKLDGTEKTIIAMGIACGMARLHSLGIIHRDLKSLNILLDMNNYPRICDFGISRFKQESNAVVTQNIGTPHWMAPEMFHTNDYTNAVDIYAYAILLWEILCEDTPFKGFSAMQIMMTVCEKDQRPAIPPDTPQNLQKVIQLCWNRDPSKRPPFDKIFKIFKSHRVSFAGCDDARVDAALKEIEASAQSFKTRGLVLTGTPSKPKPPVDQTLTPPSANPTLESLYNIVLTGNPRLIEAQLRLLNRSTSFLYYQSVWHILSAVNHQQVVKSALIGVLKLIVMNQECLAEFVARNLFMSLPYNTEENKSISLSILLPVFEKYPKYVTQALVNQLIPLITTHAVKISRLFSVYCNSFADLDSPWIVSDVLILRAKEFIAGGAAVPIMETLYFLNTKFSMFREGRLSNCLQIFVLCLSSNSMDAVITAYQCLAGLQIPALDIEPELLTTHAQIPQLHNYVVQLIASTQIKKATKNLIQVIVSSITTSAMHLQALGRLATILPMEVYSVYAAWLSPGLVVEDQMRILLTLMLIPELRPYIARLNEVFATLQRAALSKDPEILGAIPTLIRKLPLTAQHVQILSQNGFIRGYIKSTIEQNDLAAVSNCFMLLDYLCRLCFVRDFLDFLPPAIHTLMNVPQLQQFSISYLLLLSAYPEAAAEMKKMDVKRIISQVQLPPNLQKYCLDLFRNIDISPN
jgi:serine/threonine protein kinase